MLSQRKTDSASNGGRSMITVQRSMATKTRDHSAQEEKTKKRLLREEKEETAKRRQRRDC